MSEVNMANRQCCDLDIRDYKTREPWVFADFCNTTTAGFSADAVYANKKGAKCIKFDDPLGGTISMTFQVHPFKIYAMYSDGEIEDSALIAGKYTASTDGEYCTTANGAIVISVDGVVEGSVFVYPEGEYGNADKLIAGTYADGVFTATTTSDISEDGTYEIGFLFNTASGENMYDTVRKVSFNNEKTPKDFFIQMSTLDKDENGDWVPMRLTAYKASPQRSMDLSFSSDGDPAEVTITCDCLEDSDGNVMDMIELIA